MKRLATLFALFLATMISARAEVKVTVGDISDRRTTGKFFAGLEIELKISGPETAECKGLRVVVKEAKDDTGKAVAPEEDRFNDGGFAEPQSAMGGFDDHKGGDLQAKLEFENPARSAKSLTIDATVELLVPSKDAASVISVGVAKEAGKPLAQEALKTAGATITLKPVKGDDLEYTISDPNKKVASVEFCSADGKPLETSGRMSSGFAGKKDVTVTLRDKAPADVIAKVYLITEKAVVKVPLKLNAVALP